MEKTGVIFVLFTSNNVIYSLTDLEGSVLVWTSTGSQKSRGLKKSIPIVIYSAMLNISEQALKSGFSQVHLRLKGFNKSKKSIVKALNHSGLSILSLWDSTAFPHNGCRVVKRRRV
jgi:small subunit ribosomal protein S11